MISWSARNASVGLPFSPAPIGLFASRVFDMGRHSRHVLDRGQKRPEVNRLYFLHWKRHYGPKRLLQLEAKNKKWFMEWYDENSVRVLRSLPGRFLALFSSYRNSIYPSWPDAWGYTMERLLRGVSRTLWLCSFVGLLLIWHRRQARWVWLVCVIPLTVVHVFTVCHERYVFPLLPLLISYTGVMLVHIRRNTWPVLKSRFLTWAR